MFISSIKMNCRRWIVLSYRFRPMPEIYYLFSDDNMFFSFSEFGGDPADLWHEKYYNTSPPGLVPNTNHFSSINHSKHYPPLQTRTDHNAGTMYPSNPYQHYHQPHKSGSYYPPGLPANTAGTQATNMLQWQQSLHQQQQASQQLQQKLTHNPLSQQQQDDVFTSQTSNRFTDMFLRSQHPAGYFLSFNDTSPSWCQSSAASKESFFQPPITKNICPLCGKNYARPSTLKTHMRIHSGERPFHCKVCNKSFSQAANLTAHLRVHSGEKPFACSICHKTFSQSSSVTTHMRTHSGDRPYKCPICRKGFSDSSTLTKHLRIHSGEKPYRCTFCSMSFSQSGNLNRHMKVHEHHRKHDSPSSSSKPSPQ